MPTPEFLNHLESPRNIKSSATGERTFRHITTQRRCGCAASVVLGLDAANTVRDAGFKAFSCASLIGSLSWLTEWAKDRSLAELSRADALPLDSQFGLDPLKHHCSVLAKDSIIATSKLAREQLGLSTPEELSAAMVERLALVPEAFHAATFATELERERECATRVGYVVDWSSVLSSMLARLSGAESVAGQSHEQLLASCRYLDGGVRQRVGGELIQLFQDRGLLGSLPDSATLGH